MISNKNLSSNGSLCRLCLPALSVLMCACLLFLHSAPSYGGIYFRSVETSPLIVTDDSLNYIEHTITVYYEPKCTTGCTGSQRHRLSFSDSSIGDDKPGSAPNDLKAYVKNLNTLLKSHNITIQGSGTENQQINFNLGFWGAETRPSLTYVDVTFTFKVSKTEVRKRIADGAVSLDFFVVGEDTESSRYVDSIPVSIPLYNNPKVRISGLNDMELKERGNNRYRQEEQFCVYVSTQGGRYSIRASGGVGMYDPFLLSNGTETIPYRVRLSSNGTNTITVNPGDWVNANNGSDSTDCNEGTNTKLRIVLLDTWLEGKSGGTYKGTLYLTVEPA